MRGRLRGCMLWVCKGWRLEILKGVVMIDDNGSCD